MQALLSMGDQSTERKTQHFQRTDYRHLEEFPSNSLKNDTEFQSNLAGFCPDQHNNIESSSRRDFDRNNLREFQPSPKQFESAHRKSAHRNEQQTQFDSGNFSLAQTAEGELVYVKKISSEDLITLQPARDNSFQYTYGQKLPINDTNQQFFQQKLPINNTNEQFQQRLPINNTNEQFFSVNKDSITDPNVVQRFSSVSMDREISDPQKFSPKLEMKEDPMDFTTSTRYETSSYGNETSSFGIVDNRGFTSNLTMPYQDLMRVWALTPPSSRESRSPTHCDPDEEHSRQVRAYEIYMDMDTIWFILYIITKFFM